MGEIISNHMMIFDKYVKESIKKLILDVSKNPLLNFSEKSLQVRLSAQLLNYPELAKPVPTNIYQRYKKNIIKLGSEESHLTDALSITPLQMEYGINEPDPYRVDIAILDPDDIKLIDSWKFQMEEQYLDPLIAIEIGTEKSGINDMHRDHPENDAFKLKNSERGYILNIIRNTNVGQKSDKRYQKKEDQLKPFEENLKIMSLKKEYANINFVGLIIYIVYQEVKFLDVNNEWKIFKNPSTEFENAVDLKLKII